ncbi:TIGR03943 family putative permease subunit [Dendrosporobacter sp. 1207_IL3150]|uniref:TIGR03943 family putative permease subunit n=1 Tax=Dendrosporobacter sp. 1207_IL3150 TaxID=3084054 RepID=UPI002FD95D7C
MSDLGRTITLFLLANTLYQLINNGTISLYINPRFIPLTKISFVLVVIMFVLALLTLIRKVIKRQIKFTIQGIPVIVLITALSPLLFSPQVLGSSMIGQKGLFTFGGYNRIDQVQGETQQKTKQNSTSDNEKKQPETEKKKATDDYIKLSDNNFIVQFAKIQRYKTEFIGKEIELEGFIAHHPLMDKDKYMIARYTVVCCAADAQVLGFTVNGRAPFPNDTWVKVNGKIAMSKEDVYLEVTNINQINMPENPYLYAPEGLPEI